MIKSLNFLTHIVIDGDSPFGVIRNRVEVLASIRKGEYLFKQDPKEYETKLKLGLDY